MATSKKVVESTATDIRDAIDSLYDSDLEVKKLDRKIKLLKQQREVHRKVLLKHMGQAGLDGAKGSRAVISIKTQRIPSVKNRVKLDLWIRKNKAYDLYTNRIVSKAYFDRLEEGVEVPGVVVFERTNISVRKRK